ncbi:hypothetical protein JCGZ_04906 [Jatropha curcas]|uniref:Uncharacterized protein n=1 Tax=Jatropha curcas TaxID=180498 RepID=A0A067KUK6_JATCU|nr:hypothetical protein JCGZ_04906 [Jatropha curcas]
MASSPAGLFAVRENWLFEPQNLSIHSICRELAWRLMLVEVERYSVVGVFAVELDTGK